MKIRKLLTGLFIMTSFVSHPLLAAPSAWTENVSYWDKIFGKFEFGLLNLLGGWSEIMTRPARHTDDGGNIIAGVGKGFLNAALFTAGGAAHLATFPVPFDIPLPEGGVAQDETYEE